jgi:hypothetical protein
MQYILTLKNTRLQDVVDAIDAGTSNGYIEVGTTDMSTVLLRASLSKPCGSVANAVLTFSSNLTQFTGLANGEAVEARIRTSEGDDVVTELTVGTANSDIIMPITNVTSDMLFVVQSAVITHS